MKPFAVGPWSMDHRRWTAALVTLLFATYGIAATVWAGDLNFSAQVDKTTVNIGEPVNFVVTLKGDLSGVQLPAFAFPEGFVIAARSQSTSFSIRAGAAERATSLSFVLVPQQAGTFQLGPFQLEHEKNTLQTEPIEMTVKKPAVPPHLPPEGRRFTL